MHSRWFCLTTRSLAFMGMMTALQIILARVINIPLGPNLRLNLAFLPVAATGMLLGPFCAMLVAIAGDLLGNTLFSSGATFLGFTLVAALGGINYGLWLYRRRVTLLRAFLTIAPVTLVCNILLNTYFLWLMKGNAILADIPARITKNLLQFPINAILLYLFSQLMERIPARLKQM